MKKSILFLAFVLVQSIGVAQTTGAEYMQKYKTLVKYVGEGGPGVETLISHWEKMDSTDIDMLVAKFNCYYAKAGKDTVLCLPYKKYLGSKAVLTVKDKDGVPSYYYNSKVFDKELFDVALRSLNRAIALNNTRLDLRAQKINAMFQYEKESPGVAVALIKSLISENFSKCPVWTTAEGDLDADDFNGMIQDYCVMLYEIGMAGSYGAFKDISLLMIKYAPNVSDFYDNMGSYELVVNGNDKKATKYYQKALKLKPDDETALKNMEIIKKRAAAKKKNK